MSEARYVGTAKAPQVTDEQRRQALARSREARAERSAMLAALKAGRVRPADVLARRDRVALRTRVCRFLEAWPGVGRAKALQMMARAGISEGRRLGGLGSRQLRALLDEAEGRGL